jgi:predicted RNase H-like nuclease
MLTVGVDLSSQPLRTAACSIEWTVAGPRIRQLFAPPVDDDQICELASGADRVAIDAPFGWPEAFVQSIVANASGGPWPDAPASSLRFRATEMVAQQVTGNAPLSESTSPLAFLGFRAARLRTRLGPLGHPAAVDGSDGIIEVYPAAALARWGLSAREYKRDEPLHHARRIAIVDALLDALPGLSGYTDTLVASSDALDALVCALVGRAHAIGLVDQIPPELETLAGTEGWIWVPLGAPADLSSSGTERPGRVAGADRL